MKPQYQTHVVRISDLDPLIDQLEQLYPVESEREGLKVTKIIAAIDEMICAMMEHKSECFVCNSEFNLGETPEAIIAMEGHVDEDGNGEIIVGAICDACCTHSDARLIEKVEASLMEIFPEGRHDVTRESLATVK